MTEPLRRSGGEPVETWTCRRSRRASGAGCGGARPALGWFRIQGLCSASRRRPLATARRSSGAQSPAGVPNVGLPEPHIPQEGGLSSPPGRWRRRWGSPLPGSLPRGAGEGGGDAFVRFRGAVRGRARVRSQNSNLKARIPDIKAQRLESQISGLRARDPRSVSRRGFGSARWRGWRSPARCLRGGVSCSSRDTRGSPAPRW
jgi:hypothetical protein